MGEEGGEEEGKKDKRRRKGRIKENMKRRSGRTRSTSGGTRRCTTMTIIKRKFRKRNKQTVRGW